MTEYRQGTSSILLTQLFEVYEYRKYDTLATELTDGVT